MGNDKQIWNEYLNHSLINNQFEEYRKTFLLIFEKKWSDLFSKVNIDLCQIRTGNRLRPQITLFGYLANEKKYCLNQLNYIADIGMSIELIHKSSIILDDCIDGDELRHNQPAFHTIHGKDKTILFAFNLTAQALINLNNVLLDRNVGNNIYRKCIELSIRTLCDISKGALNELEMTQVDMYDMDKVKQLIDLETATLLKNSLLLGYLSNGGDNPEVEKIFVEVGSACGYIFQTMNDLEPFCNREGTIYHKGKVNIDYLNSKKNIAIAFIYERMTAAEKRKFNLLNMSDKQNAKELIEEYFLKYKVLECFMKEIASIEKMTNTLLKRIEHLGIDKLWCDSFKNFILLLTKVAKNRLQ